MKTGLYFGTFNPIHNGHLHIAQYMAQHTNLDEVWLVVTPQNPLKEKSTLLHDEQRLHMAQLAVAHVEGVHVSDVEFTLPKPSYTIDTLTHLTTQHPNTEFVLLMGEDNLRNFDRWKAHQQIIDQHFIYVYPRAITEQEKIEQPQPSKWLEHPHLRLCEVPLLPISSTQIRRLIREQKDIATLVPAPVKQYISEQQLYQQ